MRIFTLILICCIFSNFHLPLHGQEEANQSLPNIIVIVVDDMGWNDVGYHGSEIKTPTIDSLASAGAELNRFYVHPLHVLLREVH